MGLRKKPAYLEHFLPNSLSTQPNHSIITKQESMIL